MDADRVGGHPGVGVLHLPVRMALSIRLRHAAGAADQIRAQVLAFQDLLARLGSPLPSSRAGRLSPGTDRKVGNKVTLSNGHEFESC